MKQFAEKYFSILRDYFEPIAILSNKHKYSDDQIMIKLAEIYDVSTLESTLDCLYEDLSKLDWTSQELSLRNMSGLRTSYVGIEVQGTREEALAYLKRICLYSDTVIMNDPLLSELRTLKKRKGGHISSFILVAHYALNYLSIEDFFHYDSDPPICVLAPSLVWNLDERGLVEEVNDIVNTCTVAYASEVCGRDFAAIPPLRRYMSRMKGVSDLLSRAKKPEMLTDANGDEITSERMNAMRDEVERKTGRIVTQDDLLVKAFGARFIMPVFNTACNGAYSTSFTTDYKGVWKDLLWLTRKDNDVLFGLSKKRDISKDSLVIEALQQEPLKWLGNIPLDKIKEIRQQGELQDLRELISRNVDEIRNVDDEDFSETGKQVRYNIDQALRKHDAELKSLDEGYRRKYKIDVSSLLVSGTLALSSALYPPLSVSLSITSSIFGGCTVIEMFRNYLDKRNEIKELRKKPVAFLFDASKNV